MNTRKIQLKTRTGLSPFFSVVDEQDYERVSKYKWCLSSGYAFGWVPFGENNARRMNMARFILNAPFDKVVDHINGDKLDNRRSNLRIVSQAENLRHKPKPSFHEGAPIMSSVDNADGGNPNRTVVITGSTWLELKLFCAHNDLFLNATADAAIKEFLNQKQTAPKTPGERFTELATMFSTME